MRANAKRDHAPEGTDMTHHSMHLATLDRPGFGDRALKAWDLEDLVFWERLMSTPTRPRRQPGGGATERSRRCRSGTRPGSRPAGAPLRYGGTGVGLSRARGPHRARPITPATTVLLALLAGLITLWLGGVAFFGDSVRNPSATLPDRLAVVQVQSGESIAHVAARVAPDAPVGLMVARIRELNRLESAALDAGQTLIAPVS